MLRFDIGTHMLFDPRENAPQIAGRYSREQAEHCEALANLPPRLTTRANSQAS